VRQRGWDKPTYRSVSRVCRPSPQAVCVPGHPGELGHQVLGDTVVWLPSLAGTAVTHSTSPSLISGLGAPACHPMGHGGRQRLGAAVLKEWKKKKSFLWL